MKASLLTILPLFLLFNTSLAGPHVDYAKKWALRYIHFRNGDLRITKQELQAIHDLIAISAHRSAITCKAQQQSLEMVTYYWHIWQNIAQTRLNPSHERPFRLSRPEDGIHVDFLNIIDEQETACKKYAKIAQNVVYGDTLSSKLAQDAVADMRSRARVFMLDALTDVKKQLGNLYDIAFKKSQHMDDLVDMDQNEFIVRGCNIADFILAYVPNLALNTFIHADKTHNVVSQEAWQVLEKIQSIGNQVWHAIEESRYAFYQALLDELE